VQIRSINLEMLYAAKANSKCAPKAQARPNLVGRLKALVEAGLVHQVALTSVLGVRAQSHGE
jgi:hypothetical protein